MRVKRLPGSEDLPLPSQATSGAAGYDLYAAADVHLFVGEATPVPTGIAVEIPVMYVGLLVGRSGLAFKQGVTVAHVGTIDSDFRGEIKVLMKSDETGYFIKRGERIAQLLVLQTAYWNCPVIEVDTFEKTERGTAGFGSTGR